MWGAPHQSPHLVIRSPRAADSPHAAHSPGAGHGHRTAARDASRRIEGAVTEPVWRQPYAYGYFGAAPARHWQRHFGYHRAYTQWTLK